MLKLGSTILLECECSKTEQDEILDVIELEKERKISFDEFKTAIKSLFYARTDTDMLESTFSKHGIELDLKD